MRKETKRVLAAFLAAALLLLAGCGSKETPKSGSQEPQAAETGSQQTPAAQSDAQEAKDFKAAYEAYLATLADNRVSILTYNWQKGMAYDEYNNYVPVGATAPVAVADVWGDETPELLVMSALSFEGFVYAARLSVYTFENGTVRQIFDSGDYGVLDSQVGGGDNYRVFQSGDEKNLWIYVDRYSEGETITYMRFGAEGSMEPLLACLYNSFPKEDSSAPDGWRIDEEWSVDGSPATKAQFEAVVPSQEAQSNGLLFRNALYAEYGDIDDGAEKPYIYPDGAAMTYGDAVEYLRGELGTNPGESVDEKTFFASLPHDFSFLSGAGGWSSDITLAGDGTFTGSYHDSDMGDSGEGYPDGTVYVSTFSGRFGNVRRVDDYTYSMHLLELKNNVTPGEERIEDGVRYVASVPYGLENADEVMVYLPGSELRSLPWDFVTWVSMPNAWGNELPLLLPMYGLYNVADQEGWFSAFGVSAYWAEDAAYADHVEFTAETGEPQAQVLLCANLAVKDFKLLALSADGMSDAGQRQFSSTVLYELGELTPEKPLLVNTVFHGDSPNLGFSYVDASGAEHRCALDISGYDGSLYYYEF